MLYYVLMSIVGIMLAVHLAMHGQVGRMLGNVAVAHAVFMCIGALVVILLAVVGWSPEAVSRIGRVPWYLYTAGAIGSLLVIAIAWILPRIGAGPAMMIMIGGQVITGAVVSHFGWFGSPVAPLSAIRVLGLLVMDAGVFIAVGSR